MGEDINTENIPYTLQYLNLVLQYYGRKDNPLCMNAMEFVMTYVMDVS